MTSQLTEILPFLDKQSDQSRTLITHYAKLLIGHGLSVKMRYKIPFFDQLSWICYLNPIKNNGMELAFIHGNEMSNEHGLLAANGRKQIRGLAIYSLADFPEEIINSTIREAMILDEYKHQAKQ